MNVLLFVTAILMLFSIMTFGKLGQFQNTTLITQTFLKELSQKKTKRYDEAAEKIYEATTVSERKGGNEGVSQARKHLTFELFVNEEKRRSHPQEREDLAYLTKKLMHILFHEMEFYREISLLRPNFLDELIDTIERDSAEYSWKFKNKKNLSNLTLSDPELDELFSKMLAHNLLDYVTLDSGNYKVRLWLAPRIVLLTLYPPDTVEEIIKERKALYQLLRNNRLEKGDVETELKAKFQHAHDPNISDERIEYTASKTRPKD